MKRQKQEDFGEMYETGCGFAWLEAGMGIDWGLVEGLNLQQMSNPSLA